MTEKYTEDKRLLGALDYIDEKYIAEVTEDYEIFDYVGKPTRKMRFRIARQYLIYAACLVLLACAMPIVSYIVPQIGELFGGNAGNIGDTETIDMSEFADMSERDLIEHVGKVPKEFKDIVEKNLFASIRVSGDKIIKNTDEPCVIEVYDYYGKLLHQIKINIEVEGPDFRWYYESKVHSLSDGTYLLYIPYLKYSGSDKTYKGCVYDAHAIRFDENGNVLFDTIIEKKQGLDDFEFFFETDDAYLLIDGSYQKYYSRYVKIDKSGIVLKNIQMGGEESDRLYEICYADGNLVANMREHTLTKDPYDTQQVTMDDNFNILSSVSIKNNTTPDIRFPRFQQHSITKTWNVRDFVLGYSPGHKDDPVPATWGRVSSVIEYDDFILIISERDTKMFPYLPMIESSHYYYSETVYTAHALDGTILWRTAVDSTNYTLLAEVKQRCEDERKRIEEWLNEQSTEE